MARTSKQLLLPAVGILSVCFRQSPLLAVNAFSFAPLSEQRQSSVRWGIGNNVVPLSRTPTPLYAGGFEWQDPEEFGEPDVENPFKKYGEEAGLKVDAARLLSPRLEGSNLYFVGMMGSGKSAVGNLVARRK
jgi:hypothetical protein